MTLEGTNTYVVDGYVIDPGPDDAGHLARVREAAGGEVRQLTNDASHNTTPLWSPDGQEILFQTTMLPDTYQGYYPRLRVVTLAGAVRDLTGDWGYSLAAAWTPDVSP